MITTRTTVLEIATNILADRHSALPKRLLGATGTGLTAVAAVFFLIGAAMAEDAPDASGTAAEPAGPHFPGELSGNVGLVSDYLYRGASQTQEQPAIQGGIDWTHDSGLFLGIWGSSVKFSGEDTSLEQDILGGYSTTLGGLSVSVGATFFWYPASEVTLNYWEFPLELEYPLDPLTFSIGAVYSPEYLGYAGQAVYLSGGASYELPLGDDIPVTVVVDATLGYTKAESAVLTDDDYVDWNAGATLSPKGTWSGLNVQLRYSSTDTHLEDADARFVYSVQYRR